MKKLTLRLLLISFIFLLLFAFPSSQAADSQITWVKTVVASDTFTGKVVGVSEGDTIKRGLWADKNHIPPWEWQKNQRGHRKR